MFTSKLWISLVLFLTALVLSIGMIRGKTGMKTYFELRQSELILARTTSKLEQDIQNLRREIAKIENSREYVRKVLRDKYHEMNDDEEFFFFKDD